MFLSKAICLHVAFPSLVLYWVCKGATDLLPGSSSLSPPPSLPFPWKGSRFGVCGSHKKSRVCPCFDVSKSSGFMGKASQNIKGLLGAMTQCSGKVLSVSPINKFYFKMMFLR